MVLTAAHCVQGGAYFEVVLGAHDLTAAAEEGRVEVTSYLGRTHPAWEPATLAQDLALVLLPSPAPLGPTIATVVLPEPGGPAIQAGDQVRPW